MAGVGPRGVPVSIGHLGRQDVTGDLGIRRLVGRRSVRFLLERRKSEKTW